MHWCWISLLFIVKSGGLLYIRDSSNLQYTTTSTMVLFIFSKILKNNHIDGIHCGSAKFSPSEIRAFAKSQVYYFILRWVIDFSILVQN